MGEGRSWKGGSTNNIHEMHKNVDLFQNRCDDIFSLPLTYCLKVTTGGAHASSLGLAKQILSRRLKVPPNYTRKQTTSLFRMQGLF